MYRVVFLLILSMLCSPPAQGAESAAADQSFQAATKSFTDKYYERAEKEFGEFIAKFPQSPRVPEVILLQARCRFERKNYKEAADLLTSRMSSAGEWGDQYQYWKAEAQFYQQDFVAASEAYADLLKAYPNSPLRLLASYGEAFAQFNRGNFPRTVELLKDPASAFQQAAQKATNDTDVVRGYLLLGEALYAQKSFLAVEEALGKLVNRKLKPEVDWQREYLLANSQLAAGRSEDALKRVTNLVTLATAATNSVLHATSLMFQAAIMENKQPEAAMQTYEQITQLQGASASQRRQAVLKIVALTVVQNRLTNAIERLRAFVAQNAQDPDSDLIRLTLGDLHLKHFYALRQKGAKAELQANLAAVTNSLQQAKGSFDFIINVFTNSPLVGKALLNRGWCCWEEAQLFAAPGKIAESQQAFQAAVGRLPVSEDQAIARFKWADCQFEQKDYTNALRNYKLLIESYANLPQVKTNLFDQALDHILRASIEVKDFESAKEAMDKNLDWFPNSLLSHRGSLTHSQALLDHGQPSKARATLTNFQERFPNSTLMPEVQLTIARTYEQEADWPSAIRQYDRWVSRFTDHAARPQAEFDRAWVHYQAGQETNALALFTNYVAQFSSGPLAPLAQFWVADYYFRQHDYYAAELNYQHRILLQTTNATSSGLRYPSRLMAAKAAFLRPQYSQARDHLNGLITDLINDTNSPAALLPEAYFVLGDVELNEPATASTNNLAKFGNAITIFERILRSTNANRLEPLARGKIAYCHLQLQRFEQATNEFYNVIRSPMADVTARSQAELGIGEALERQAQQKATPPEQREQLLKSALDHYLNVFQGKNVKLEKSERADPFWVRKAGLEAGRLAESLRLLEPAWRTYDRLVTQLPSLRPFLEEKIKKLKQAEAP